MAEYVLVGHVRAVPSVMPELMATLPKPELRALADRRHRVGRFSALLALILRQAGYSTAHRRTNHHGPDDP